MFEFDFYQYMLTLSILMFSYIIIMVIGYVERSNIIMVSLIFFWHTLFSFTYYFFTINNPADAKGYYLRSELVESFNFKFGTEFVTYLTSFLSQDLSANYLNSTLVFNLIGTLGLLLLYFCLEKYLFGLSKFWNLIIFLPSLSFWSAGLGKDAISFFSVCLFLYSIAKMKKLIFLIPIAFICMLVVRPHIAFMILVSFVIYFIFKSKVPVLIKFLTFPLVLSIMILSSSFIQRYVGLDDASISSIGGYVDERQNTNQGGGSSIDLQAMSYPMQIFTYVFRPLPFDAHSPLALLTSIENVILLFLFIYILFKNKFRLNAFIEGKNTWLLIYAFLTCSMLAVTTANLGIATRQKWMFMPILLYLLVYAFYRYKQSRHMISTKK